ncbi:hypothetical protein [Apibacter sp. HY039]|uniref:hypothetical protein n=1 Tax=Apibacter sp. HY039 TaxID=2501476 RepID=UPI000FEB61B2|nr:hypothetical protein [Apibacter sp. HY039]
METINGVSFEEYAAASAHLGQGMSEEQVIEILGLDKSVWEETLSQWNVRLGELMAENMEYTTRFGEIFANPKVGRFAETSTPSVDMESLLQIAPDYETYQDILWHQSVASQHGIDPVSVLESYGLDVGRWGSLNMHYMKDGINSLDHSAPDFNERNEYYIALMDSLKAKWEKYYNEK